MSKNTCNSGKQSTCYSSGRRDGCFQGTCNSNSNSFQSNMAKSSGCSGEGGKCYNAGFHDGANSCKSNRGSDFHRNWK